MNKLEPQLEKQLVRRLKIFGCILLFFAVAALLYNLVPSFASDVNALDEEIALELEDEPPPLNPVFVSSVFSIVGGGLLIISWKKRKRLFSSSPENKDSE